MALKLSNPTRISPASRLDPADTSDVREEPRSIDLFPAKRPFPVRLANRGLKGLAALRWRARLSRFGHGSSIASPAHIVGHGSICIGERVTIWRYGRLEALNAAPGIHRIIIGDQTVIQPHVHIGAVTCVQIGRGVLMASFVYISDHDHDFSDPARPVINNRRLIARPVTIGDYVWIGEKAMVLKGVGVGHHSIIGAGSIVTRDIPPYSIAVGSPARVIRRYDPGEKVWLPVNSDSGPTP